MKDVLGTNKRDVTIDIIKGLGIVFMVLGHSYFPFQKFIYLFHMTSGFGVLPFFNSSKKYVKT